MDLISEIGYTIRITKKGESKHIMVQQWCYFCQCNDNTAWNMIIQLATKLITLLESVDSIPA